MDGAPFERYTFILHIGKGAGGGGMEHANSTAISVYSDEYLPGVAAHEFFSSVECEAYPPVIAGSRDDTKEQIHARSVFAEGRIRFTFHR